MADLRMIRELIERGVALSMVEKQALEVPQEPVRMAIVVVAAGPMIFIFPFFQKYFVHGITIGSLKG